MLIQVLICLFLIILNSVVLHVFIYNSGQIAHRVVVTCSMSILTCPCPITIHIFSMEEEFRNKGLTNRVLVYFSKEDKRE